MLSRQNIVRINMVFGILCWITLVFINFYVIFRQTRGLATGIPDAVPELLIIALIAFTFLVFKYSLQETESIDILDLLWRVFVTGLVSTIISLLFRFFMFRFTNSPMNTNPYVGGFIYYVNVGLIILFMVSTFVVWKKLTLYQKSRSLIRLWKVFQYSLFATLFFVFLDYEFFDAFFIVVFVILMIMGIILSANLKWVAYLDFRQKWKSILLIVLSLMYLGYFFEHLRSFPHLQDPKTELWNNVSIFALFSFIAIYAIFSLLVLLFNLPTSSVFEQKLEEVVNFQRLSQSPQSGQSEDHVFDILLESSVSAVMANAAWLEINQENEKTPRIVPYKIDRKKILKLKESLQLSAALFWTANEPVKPLKIGKRLHSLKDDDFKSLLAFPVIVQNRHIGSLFLLKDVSDGFNKEMSEIIKTFVNQASITIENFRLISEAIAHERYKEELKIAKKVQKSLLPESLELSESLEISAFSRAADEVGGDYYDIYKIDENRIVLIIGDVSGKGTSAAFHMSQMKGVFHSLVQLDLSPKAFMVNANKALSRCLEKTSFITVSYFIIDTKAKTVEFARAGHCPTLYYSNKQKKSIYYATRGLGLGILRNDNFSRYVEVEKIDYSSNDIILLYTDGVTEAKNTRDEFYGYERLQQFIEANYKKSPKAIQDDLIRELYVFCDRQAPEDDFTTMIIKFV